MSNSRGADGRLRVGIIGAGIIANSHLPYVRKAGGEPVAVCDLSIAAASELADRHAIQRVYRSVADMLDVEKLDAVHVLTPPHAHARVAVAALERGIPALIEKPLALTLADVEAMSAAARRGNTFFTADHNRLFDPPMLEARRLYESGELGELVAIESYQAGVASERAWLDEMAGGGIGDLVPHPLYLQLFFLGAVERLEAVAWSPKGTGRIEELRVLMQGQGRTGSLTITMNSSPMMNTLKLCGSRMTVEVNLNNMTIVKRRDYKVPKIIAKPLPNLDESWQLVSQTARNTIDFVRGKIRYYPGMGELIQRFYDAIRRGTPPPVSEAEAMAVVDVTSRIWEAVAARPAPATPAGAGEAAAAAAQPVAAAPAAKPSSKPRASRTHAAAGDVPAGTRAEAVTADPEKAKAAEPSKARTAGVPPVSSVEPLPAKAAASPEAPMAAPAIDEPKEPAADDLAATDGMGE